MCGDRFGLLWYTPRPISSHNRICSSRCWVLHGSYKYTYPAWAFISGTNRCWQILETGIIMVLQMANLLTNHMMKWQQSSPVLSACGLKSILTARMGPCVTIWPMVTDQWPYQFHSIISSLFLHGSCDCSNNKRLLETVESDSNAIVGRYIFPLAETYV